MTRDEIGKDIENIVFSECPGGPQEGCCEFCPADSCMSATLDGVELTSNEVDIALDIKYVTEQVNELQEA